MIASGRSARSERPPAVAVLLGGPSAEHDVSVVSGTAVAEALRAAGFPVQPILLDVAGGWWWLPADHRRGFRHFLAGRKWCGHDWNSRRDMFPHSLSLPHP